MRSRRPVQKKKKNDRARKMLKMKNPKSFRKPNGVTKRTKEIFTDRKSILFENLLKKMILMQVQIISKSRIGESYHVMSVKQMSCLEIPNAAV